MPEAVVVGIRYQLFLTETNFTGFLRNAELKYQSFCYSAQIVISDIANKHCHFGDSL